MQCNCFFFSSSSVETALCTEVFGIYGSHLITKLRDDLICFHIDNMLTHDSTSVQQATVVVLCEYILHFVVMKRLGPVSLTVIPFPVHVSLKM